MNDLLLTETIRRGQINIAYNEQFHVSGGYTFVELAPALTYTRLFASYILQVLSAQTPITQKSITHFCVIKKQSLSLHKK